MAGSDVWSRFALDPRIEANARLRAADRDRDVVQEVLSSAYADGRLTREELDERSDLSVGARTLGELPGLLADLVPATVVRPAAPMRTHRAEAELRYRRQRQAALIMFLTPTLICWIVWLSVLSAGVGTSFPWPAFVMIVTGVRYFQLATAREDTITSIERHLEHRELRRIAARKRWQGRILPYPPPPAPPRAAGDHRDVNPG